MKHGFAVKVFENFPRGTSKISESNNRDSWGKMADG
jgi:hypothetical protein